MSASRPPGMIAAVKVGGQRQHACLPQQKEDHDNRHRQAEAHARYASEHGGNVHAFMVKNFSNAL